MKALYILAYWLAGLFKSIILLGLVVSKLNHSPKKPDLPATVDLTVVEVIGNLGLRFRFWNDVLKWRILPRIRI